MSDYIDNILNTVYGYEANQASEIMHKKTNIKKYKKKKNINFKKNLKLIDDGESISDKKKKNRR